MYGYFYEHFLTTNENISEIHLDLARYHELSRFSSPGDEYDKTAALFHLRRAADCGVLEAVIASARIYLQLPHNILEDIDLPFSLEHEDIGLDYMTYAAEAGDRAAMIFLAKVYDTGLNLGTRVRSWTEAVRLYSKAVAALTEMDDDGHFDGTMDDPQYQLIARQAEMYRDGGFGLEINYVKAGEFWNSKDPERLKFQLQKASYNCL
ncbi:hypothetical protein QYM36_008735 [Artemia franciscana]|uniref:Uncharacterized protein n=1 Tax=Artemia franciscana TaxID=6661 RepID=A0AA88HS48_ARTSF|nr:hypothetical protein QYM36_008735 [Artemia franciscana]